MGIKWKKWKEIVSFLAFAAGLTILVIYLVPAASMWAAFGADIFKGPQDYQESPEFRKLIGGKLSELLGVATGGQTDSELFSDSTTAVFMNDPEESETFEGSWDDYQEYLAEQQAHYEEMAADYGLDAYDGWYDYDDIYDYYDSGYGYHVNSGKDLDAYMAELAQNKNILYAVVYRNKLLYSNIEGYGNRTGEEWKDEDFSEAIDAKAYNFTLWYNRENDGRVQIIKDGREEDVYGDGIYRDTSRWRVPGYANFTPGENTKEAVVFLAVAKEPQLYLVNSNTGSGYYQYGGRLYRMRQNGIYLRSQAVRMERLFTAAVLLLAIAFLMRKSRRQAVERIGDFLGKICLEIKLFLLLLLLILLTGMGGGVFGQFVWWLRNGLDYYNWSGDYIYEVARLTRAGRYLAAWGWLFYLVVLDWRMNGKRQKKPVFDLLRVKDLKDPIQKRLVRRQRRTLLAEIVLLVLFAAAVCILWMMQGEFWNQLTGGYGYNYAYDVYEVVAEEGYPFDMRDAYMLTACVIFSALFVFTLITVFGLKKNKQLAMDIGALTDQILAVRKGSLTGELTLSGDTDLREAADNLNQIRKGLETALREQMRSERLKVDLVTNVSHDIKTPLTSIISYTELLRQEEDLPQHVKEYIQILSEKAERLRGIVQDVFEISKATSGQLPIRMETLDLGKLLRQTLADMNDRIEASGLTMRTTIPESPVPVLADGQRLYRVFQNLLQNALRYSLEGSRVFLALTEEAGEAIVRIKNISGVELADTKDFTERFVRGDDSRTDGGSGLGLSIAKSFTEACGGRLTVETDADLFTVTVAFRISGQEQTAEKQMMAEGKSDDAGE